MIVFPPLCDEVSVSLAFVSFTFPPSYQSSLKLSLNRCLRLVLCLFLIPFPSLFAEILSAVVCFISFAKLKAWPVSSNCNQQE